MTAFPALAQVSLGFIPMGHFELRSSCSVANLENMNKETVSYMDIQGSPGYQISDDGAVRRLLGDGMVRHLAIVRKLDGYCAVSVIDSSGKKRQALVHHLVLEAFVGPRPVGSVTRHLNGFRFDNRVSNLAWGSYVENEADKRSHGRTPLGEKHPNHRFTPDEIHEVRRLLSRGVMKKWIAKKYGVSPTAVRWIETGKTWSHLPAESVAPGNK